MHRRKVTNRFMRATRVRNSLPSIEPLPRGEWNRIQVLVVVWLLWISGCGVGKVDDSVTNASRVVRIAAASDLRYVLPKLIDAFHKQDGQIEFSVTYGASGQLYSQLANQAPFDLFLSADADYVKRLVDSEAAAKETQFPYARGRLVIWMPKESSFDLESLGAAVIADATIRKIAIANPRTAPFGRAAEEAIQKLGLAEQLADRLVYGETVAQAAQMVESGAADAGIISMSLAEAPAMKEKGKYWIVPDEMFRPLVQTGVILSWAQDREGAEAFSEFMRGAGRAILTSSGLGELEP